MKKTLTASAVAIAATMGGSSAWADCGEVSITEMNWASAAVVTAVSSFIMTEGYGCEVKKVPSSTVPSVTSVAETGEPDIVTELWLNSAPIYADLEAEGKIVTLANILSDGGEENWYIPKYLADAHPELTKIENIFANPELVGGRFHNCPSGWGCRVVGDNLAKAFGMREMDGLDVFDHGSGETLATSLASAYDAKEPWFGYYWAPTAILGKYPMVAVDLGAFDAAIHECNGKIDCPTPGISNFAKAPVYTGATPNFIEAEPEVAELMRNVSFTNAQMGDILAWQEANKASADEAAAYFLTSYKDVWGAWLNDEARGKLAALLQ